MEFLDNNYLTQYEAQTFTEKLKNSIVNHILEEEEQRLGYSPRFTETALVVSYNAGKKSPEIKALGASTLMKDDKGIVKDLVLNNMMTWFAGLFSPPTTNHKRDIVDVGGTTKTLLVVGGGAGQFNVRSGGVLTGTEVQVGDGVAAPTRTDFNINNAFPDAPQSDRQPTNTGGWNPALGRITVAKSIVTAINAGTVIEVGLFASWEEDLTATVVKFMLTHDKLSPSVPFAIGETLNITCTFTF